MIWCDCKTSLADTLSDPMIQAVMAADGVDAQELEQSLRTIARHLENRRSRRTIDAIGSCLVC